MRRFLPLAVLLVLAVSACSGPEHLAVVGNAPGSLGPGEQRVVVAYRTEEGDDLARPDLEAELEVTREGGEPQRVPTEFVWLIEGERGLYVAHVDFDQGGDWTATLFPEGENPTRRSPFSVAADVTTPEVGDPAPASASETISDVGGDLSLVTTDPDPDPDMYEVSIADAVTDGTPAVIVFATPAFCQTAICGPMLDQVKAQKAVTDADVDWVHVEVYELEDVTDLVLVPAVTEWGLPSEPWVFVVDADGIVTHRFEGVVGDDELAEAIAQVTS